MIMISRSMLLTIGLLALPVAPAIAQQNNPAGDSTAKGTTQGGGDAGKSTGPAAASSNTGTSASGDVKSTNTTPPGRTSTGLPSEKQPR